MNPVEKELLKIKRMVAAGKCDECGGGLWSPDAGLLKHKPGCGYYIPARGDGIAAEHSARRIRKTQYLPGAKP